MRKPKRKVSRLTTRSTDEEIVRWTKSHDVFDRLETSISEDQQSGEQSQA